MWREFRYANGKRFAVDMEKVSMVQCSSDGHAVLFIDGCDTGVEIDAYYDEFTTQELGVE